MKKQGLALQLAISKTMLVKLAKQNKEAKTIEDLKEINEMLIVELTNTLSLSSIYLDKNVNVKTLDINVDEK